MEKVTDKKVLVTGGTGLLGAHLLQQLVARGYAVRAICRNSSSKKVVEKVFGAYSKNGLSDLKKIEWITADVTDYFSLEEAFVGIDLVYHVAGFISFQSKDKKQLENVNIQGSANVVNAALQCGVKKVVYVSSVAALGRADLQDMINEETPWKNSPVNTHYAVTKQAGEREIWRGSEEGLEVLVVNPGLIVGYGDWATGTGKIIKRIAEGQSFYTDGSNGWVDVRDTARAMIELDEAGVHGEKFILIAENVSFEKGFAVLAKHLGSKAPSIKAGKTMMKMAVWSEKLASLLFSKEPLVTPETIMTASLQSRYDNSKIKEKIGFEFIPFEETIAEVSKWYKAEKNRKFLFNIRMENYLQRINMDSTWLIEVDGVRILVDPWLIGTETDGFKWLNRQWHVHSVMAIDEIPDFDFILITQPYDDHCHIKTLKEIYKGKPIFADKRAYGKIKKNLPDANVKIINEKTREIINYNGVEIFLSPTDMLYNGCYIKSKNSRILYLPHGIEIKDKFLKHFPTPVDVVLTSASTYTLPFWLGGKVAKGIANVKEIQAHFKPKQIFTTHDEPKDGIGLVTKVAKKYYPSQEEFSKEIGNHAWIVNTHEKLEI